MAKRVTNLDQFREGYENEVAANPKRSILDDLNTLKSYIDKLNDSVDYYVDLDKLKDFDFQDFKIDNEDEIIDVFEEVSEGGNDVKDKREAKNIVSLDFFRTELGKEKNSKRDLKYIVDQIILNNDNDALTGVPLLQSALPQVKEISIFAGYIRDQVDVAKLTNQLDTPLIIIAPSNFAISKKLSGLKPWEFPEDVEKDETKAESNLTNFVKSHIIKEKSSSLEQWDKFFESTEVISKYVETLNKNIVSINREEGKTSIVSLRLDNDGIYTFGYEVLDMVRVDNGFILVINDSLIVPDMEKLDDDQE